MMAGRARTDPSSFTITPGDLEKESDLLGPSLAQIPLWPVSWYQLGAAVYRALWWVPEGHVGGLEDMLSDFGELTVVEGAHLK